MLTEHFIEVKEKEEEEIIDQELTIIRYQYTNRRNNFTFILKQSGENEIIRASIVRMKVKERERARVRPIKWILSQKFRIPYHLHFMSHVKNNFTDVYNICINHTLSEDNIHNSFQMINNRCCSCRWCYCCCYCYCCCICFCYIYSINVCNF